MKLNRRKFLAGITAFTGAAVCGSAYWVGTSERFSARWMRQMIAEARRSMAPPAVKPAPMAWSSNEVRICWLGHATVLINFFGLHILTDPVFSTRVGIDVGLGTVGPKRFIAPALRFNELPPIDVVLMSHAHMDHLDLPSLRRFPDSTFTVSARTTREIFASSPLRDSIELGWGERARFEGATGDLEIEAFEVKHWGRRWPNDIDRGYNGYVLRREGRTILFGGDTAYTPLFSQIRSRGPFDAAIMPIGAYDPWIRSHCTPEEAVTMANAAGAGYLIPVHHQTFRLSEEPMNEPIERFTEALQSEPERLALRQVGESFCLS